jgi:hypothetical protein
MHRFGQNLVEICTWGIVTYLQPCTQQKQRKIIIKKIKMKKIISKNNFYPALASPQARCPFVVLFHPHTLQPPLIDLQPGPPQLGISCILQEERERKLMHSERKPKSNFKN